MMIPAPTRCYYGTFLPFVLLRCSARLPLVSLLSHFARHSGLLCCPTQLQSKTASNKKKRRAREAECVLYVFTFGSKTSLVRSFTGLSFSCLIEIPRTNISSKYTVVFVIIVSAFTRCCCSRPNKPS